MRMAEEWTPFSWHCSNCGTIVTGYKNANGDIKVECSRCHVVMVRRIKGRRHDNPQEAMQAVFLLCGASGQLEPAACRLCRNVSWTPGAASDGAE